MIARIPLDKFKARWRDQIFGDHELTYATRCVGYSMADFITMNSTKEHYRETGKVVIFPSQESLREKAGVNVDTVKLAVRQMIDQGHLKRLSKGNQFSGANRYRVILRSAA